MSIRTRFAPSPTGYLHIGGVRTALFNWLLTRHLGGQFILRIDDTDSERNRPEALQPILDGFRWLGIQWDEGPEVGGPVGPYFQSQRLESYREQAMNLLKQGLAYPDYLSKEELDAERKRAEKAKRAYIHRGPLRDLPPGEGYERYLQQPTAIRFRVPDDQTVIIPDAICGHCEQKSDLISDPVILRIDGSPIYNFASVIDDIAMKITHVVRAREHLTNTFTQMLMFSALGASIPVMAHVPVVNEPKSKKKLSKRDMKKFVTSEISDKLQAIGYTPEQIEARDDLNPATVAFYRELGYLPAGLINYLGRLGWSLDDKSELIPLDQMIAHFSLERVNSSSASFDPDKLYWVNGEYMRQVPTAEKVKMGIPYLHRAGWLPETPSDSQVALLTRIIEACGDRIKLYSDVLQFCPPFFMAELVYDPKAVEKRLLKIGARDHLQAFLKILTDTNDWVAANLDKVLHDYCTAQNIKPGEMVHPLRAATTGREIGFGLFDTLEILGKSVTLQRIQQTLNKFNL